MPARIHRLRPTAAAAIAVLALFAALGGSALAAGVFVKSGEQLEPAAIGPRQVESQPVRLQHTPRAGVTRSAKKETRELDGRGLATIVTLALPEGDWVVTARTAYTASTSGQITCALARNKSRPPHDFGVLDHFRTDPRRGARGEVRLTGPVAANGAGFEVALVCTGPARGTLKLDASRIAAERVGGRKRPGSARGASRSESR